MKYIVYADTHWHSAKSTYTPLGYEPNSVFLGDIRDVHCLKKDAKTVEKHIKGHNVWCETKGLINVRGNHEGIYSKDLPLFVTRDGVMFLHSHHLFYSDKQMKKWEKKTAGISKFKFYGIRLLNKLRKLKSSKMSEKKLEVMAKFAAEHGCHTTVCGHFHMSYDGMVDTVVEHEGHRKNALLLGGRSFTAHEIRVIVCDCGRTEVEI
ncbi:hypothetical protein KAR91_40610 [Candidatus Pacearchaeota archaeon]|nr:hypothetical protein [Candidatus Pacearchaeota archaeon]